MTTDVSGKTVTVAEATGTAPTDDTILQRLGERRAELDKREADIKMREAIVAAAEKQLVERGDALKALEAQIAALSQQKQAMEDQQFAGVVKLYENMKPQDAATIFNGLDLPVLLRVAKAMDPRKMSPILAKMAATRAQELTMQLAAVDTDPAPTVSSVAAVDPNALPQIVGH
jgi:flagellar motility protein MotE (MotC chaperone)